MITHVLTDDHKHSICSGGVFGDLAITLEDARDITNNLYFDCENCYIILAPQEYNSILTDKPNWREALPGETPGQLEPEL